MKRGDGKTYFEISKRIMADSGRVTRMPIIKRWRLDIRPEDRERYFKGELVEPVNPIVFYVDRNFPKLYQKSIIEAVREWRQAFEQAGFKNAIDARLAPTPKEDPDFCMYDSRYPYISWKTSGTANAYGPSPCEGRSGEITACHVGVFSSVMAAMRAAETGDNPRNRTLARTGTQPQRKQSCVYRQSARQRISVASRHWKFNYGLRAIQLCPPTWRQSEARQSSYTNRSLRPLGYRMGLPHIPRRHS